MCISTFWYFALIFSLFLYHRYYTKARDVLYHYSHMPSFYGIHQDCDEIVKQLIVQLREQLRNPKVMTILSLVHVFWLSRMELLLNAFLFFHLLWVSVLMETKNINEISRIYSESVSYVSTTITLLKSESKQCWILIDLPSVRKKL